MSRNTRRAAVRQPTTFQLLQSKYLFATPKPALTHRREVGTLNLKTVHRIKEMDKPISTGQEVKRGRFRVRDMIGKFAAVEQKEKELENRDLVRQVNKGPDMMFDMMKRFKDLSNLQKRSDLIEYRKQDCVDEFNPVEMKKMTKQKKAQDAPILDKQERQVIVKYPSSKTHIGSLEEHEKSPLTVVKGSPCSLIKAKQGHVSKKLASSLSLPLTQQTMSYGRVKAISFSTLLMDSQPQSEYGLLVMEKPQKWNLAIVLLHPDICELAFSARESLEHHHHHKQHLLELQPHKKGTEVPRADQAGLQTVKPLTCEIQHKMNQEILQNGTAEFVQFKDHHSSVVPPDDCCERPLLIYNNKDPSGDVEKDIFMMCPKSSLCQLKSQIHRHASLILQTSGGSYSPEQSMTSNDCLSSEALVGKPMRTDRENLEPVTSSTPLFSLLKPINNTTLEYWDNHTSKHTSQNLTSRTENTCDDSASHPSNGKTSLIPQKTIHAARTHQTDNFHK